MKKMINVLIATAAAGAFGWSSGKWIFNFPSPAGLGAGLGILALTYGILLIIGSSSPNQKDPFQ